MQIKKYKINLTIFLILTVSTVLIGCAKSSQNSSSNDNESSTIQAAQNSKISELDLELANTFTDTYYTNLQIGYFDKYSDNLHIDYYASFSGAYQALLNAGVGGDWYDELLVAISTSKADETSKLSILAIAYSDSNKSDVANFKTNTTSKINDLNSIDQINAFTWDYSNLILSPPQKTIYWVLGEPIIFFEEYSRLYPSPGNFWSNTYLYQIGYNSYTRKLSIKPRNYGTTYYCGITSAIYDEFSTYSNSQLYLDARIRDRYDC